MHLRKEERRQQHLVVGPEQALRVRVHGASPLWRGQHFHAFLPLCRDAPAGGATGTAAGAPQGYMAQKPGDTSAIYFSVCGNVQTAVSQACAIRLMPTTLVDRPCPAPLFPAVCASADREWRLSFVHARHRCSGGSARELPASPCSFRPPFTFTHTNPRPPS